MKVKNGFTLIELLIVISIVALLIALLLPAMNAVRKNASSLKCAASIRQVAAAQFAHAADHDGSFVHGPPSHPGLTGPVSVWAIWDRHNGPIETDGWFGVGLLWRERYLTELTGAYCPLWTPTNYQHDDAMFGFHADPVNAPGHGDQVAWSYHYRSAMDSDDADPRPPWIDDDDGGDPFIADAFTIVPGDAGVAPAPAKQYAHETGYNVGYIDGSVLFLADRNHVVADHAPGWTEHEETESDIWEPYFEKQSGYYLNGPNAGSVDTGDAGGE